VFEGVEEGMPQKGFMGEGQHAYDKRLRQFVEEEQFARARSKAFLEYEEEKQLSSDGEGDGSIPPCLFGTTSSDDLKADSDEEDEEESEEEQDEEVKEEKAEKDGQRAGPLHPSRVSDMEDKQDAEVEDEKAEKDRTEERIIARSKAYLEYEGEQQEAAEAAEESKRAQSKALSELEEEQEEKVAEEKEKGKREAAEETKRAQSKALSIVLSSTLPLLPLLLAALPHTPNMPCCAQLSSLPFGPSQPSRPQLLHLAYLPCRSLEKDGAGQPFGRPSQPRECGVVRFKEKSTPPHPPHPHLLIPPPCQ
jgi:hypothetical protein